jgi:hypothetical protein
MNAMLLEGAVCQYTRAGKKVAANRKATRKATVIVGVATKAARRTHRLCTGYVENDYEENVL